MYRCGLAILIFALACATGCTDQNAERDAELPGVEAPVVRAQCPADASPMGVAVTPRNPPTTSGEIPKSYVARKVIVCEVTDLGPGEKPGEIHYTIVTKEAPITEALLQALKLPNREFIHADSGSCRMDYQPLPYILLVDASGAAVHPRIPVDACGKVRVEVERALSNLTLREVRRRPVNDILIAR